MKSLSLMAALLLVSASACAQTVWRCGADGRSYSNSPCVDGRALALADTRSDAEVQAARQTLAGEQALAQRLVQERHEREREWRAAGSGLSGIKPQPQPQPRADAVKPKLPKPLLRSKRHPPAAAGTWHAVAQASR